MYSTVRELPGRGVVNDDVAGQTECRSRQLAEPLGQTSDSAVIDSGLDGVAAESTLEQCLTYFSTSSGRRA